MQDRLESKKRGKETNQVSLRSYWPYFVPLLVFLGYLAFHFWLMSVLKNQSDDTIYVKRGARFVPVMNDEAVQSELIAVSAAGLFCLCSTLFFAWLNYRLGRTLDSLIPRDTSKEARREAVRRFLLGQLPPFFVSKESPLKLYPRGNLKEPSEEGRVACVFRFSRLTRAGLMGGCIFSGAVFLLGVSLGVFGPYLDPEIHNAPLLTLLYSLFFLPAYTACLLAWRRRKEAFLVNEQGITHVTAEKASRFVAWEDIGRITCHATAQQVQVHHVQVDLPPLLMEHQLEGFHVLREILYRKCPDRCPASWKNLF